MAVRLPLAGKLRLRDLIGLRLGVPIGQYFLISLTISLMSIVFGVPFDRFYGKAGFVIFWAMNFVTQVSEKVLGLVLRGGDAMR